MIIRKRKPSDAGSERRIITSMITNTNFLRQVRGFYTPDCMEADFTRVVADWCIDYFLEYSESPGRNIQEIFRHKAKAGMQEEEQDQIKTFLGSISNEYEKSDKQFNLEYELNIAEEHFRLAAARNLRDNLNISIASSDPIEAENSIAEFRRVTRAKTKGVSVFEDKELIFQAFNDNVNHLFSLPGKLGKAIGSFERGNLFAVMAGSGVGKTWWLMLIALRAALAGLNVLFVSYEMSEMQLLRRFASWVTGLPIKQHAGIIPIPVFDCWKNQAGECKQGCKESVLDEAPRDENGNIDRSRCSFITIPESIDIGYKPCTQCRGKRDYDLAVWHKLVERSAIEPEIALKKFNAVRKLKRAGEIRIVQFPSQTQSIDDLKAYRENLRYYENFEEDVLITDYADKMRYRAESYRLGLNEIWEGHKSIAQEDNIFVATGSQTNADRSGKDIKEGDWAESIHKKNVLDSAMSINQTKDERAKGVFRMEPMKKRHEGFDVLGQVWVLGQYMIGRPYIDSEVKGGIYLY